MRSFTQAWLVSAWLLALVSIGLAAPGVAQRALYWERVDVEARLDEAGVLHIREVQTMVLSGDWNGGERRFQPGTARLQFDRMSKQQPDGSFREMRQGDLDVLDQWRFTDGLTLRWRGRRPTDPEFDQTRLVYALEYRMSDVLQEVERSAAGQRQFLFDHQFLFTERSGRVEHLHLEVAYDPVWQSGSRSGFVVDRTPVPPGEGYRLSEKLVYRGDGDFALVHVPPA